MTYTWRNHSNEIDGCLIHRSGSEVVEWMSGLDPGFLSLNLKTFVLDSDTLSSIHIIHPPSTNLLKKPQKASFESLIYKSTSFYKEKLNRDFPCWNQSYGKNYCREEITAKNRVDNWEIWTHGLHRPKDNTTEIDRCLRSSIDTSPSDWYCDNLLVDVCDRNKSEMNNFAHDRHFILKTYQWYLIINVSNFTEVETLINWKTINLVYELYAWWPLQIIFILNYDLSCWWGAKWR